MNATRSASIWILPVVLSALALPAFAPAFAATAKPKAAAHSVVPFIADDLDRALVDARKTNRPIFVESWAPW